MSTHNNENQQGGFTGSDYLSPFPQSPFSPIPQMWPYSSTMVPQVYSSPTGDNVIIPLTNKHMIPYVDIDTGMNDNYIAQKQITDYLYYRVLDKWYMNQTCVIFLNI